MVEVYYNPDSYIVKVDGHAKSGEYGHDLVCAAVSMLVHTLIANAQFFDNKAEIKLKEGSAYILCKPREENEGACRIALDSVCVGFELLANSYPENISYKIV